MPHFLQDIQRPLRPPADRRRSARRPVRFACRRRPSCLPIRLSCRSGPKSHCGRSGFPADDAYGNPLDFTPANALTSLLYSGDQSDRRTAMQYLRARYYNPASGTFNRIDPFFGNLQDPQSLHTYLYVHGDPVQGIDPTGMWFLMSTLSSLRTGFSGRLKKAGSALVSKRMLLGKITSVQNPLAPAMALNNIRKSPIPDGFMFNVGYGGATHGVGGTGTASIYLHFATGRIYFFASLEYGFVPVSTYIRARRRGPSINGGFVWNARDPSDLAGPSLNAAYPIWILARNYHLLNPLLPNVKGMGRWMTLIREYEVGKFADRSGTVQIVQAVGGDTVGAFYGTRAYSWSATAGYTFPPLELLDAHDIPDAIDSIVGHVADEVVDAVRTILFRLFPFALPPP